MSYETVSSKVAREYCQRFPNVATRTLVRKAWKERPECWTTLNACGLAFRRTRGNQGAKSRKQKKDKSQFRKNKTAGELLFPLPDGIEEITDWHIEQLDERGWWAVLSDLHIPYHDKSAVDLVLKEAENRKVVGVLLNGDLMDGHSISWWQRDPRERDFSLELQKLREFTGHIRRRFHKQRIVWKFGNHCLRWENWLMQKAPELLDIPDFQLPEMSHANKHGIEIVTNNQPIRLGKSLNCLHGHEVRGGIQAPVNPARTLYNRVKTICFCGHHHQSSNHSEKAPIESHVVTCWSTGCLCSMRPKYDTLNKWNHGAAFVHIGTDGAFEMNNFRIIHGKIYS